MTNKPSDTVAKRPRYSRTKNGCQPCRLRRKKCDEEKPKCGGCKRNHLMCGWPGPQDVTMKKPEKSSRNSRLSSHVIVAPDSPTSPYELEIPSESLSVTRKSPSYRSQDPAVINFVRTYHPIFKQPPPSVFGALSHSTSRVLFEYYYHKTASHVSAHPHDFNPFIKHLMPLAVSHDLILQSLLAWSGSHLSIISIEVKATTCMHYAQAIQGIKHGLTKYATGQEDMIMELLISTLMLCFIEVCHLFPYIKFNSELKQITRGNHNGCAFHHVKAARQLLFRALELPSSKLDNEIRAFVIEHFIYVAVLSNISLGAESDNWILEDVRLLIPMVLRSPGKATGMFCGAAHELFQLIPQVTIFSRKVVEEQDATGFASWASINAYVTLRSSITAWCSDTDNENFDISGKIYQQALLLYLELSMTRSGGAGSLESTAATSVKEAMETATELIECLPLDCDIATTLCWPIAVIGSCATQAKHQCVISQRLKLMHCMLGFNNLESTRQLLDVLWSDKELGVVGPWSIEPQMRKQGAIIAFL